MSTATNSEQNSKIRTISAGLYSGGPNMDDLRAFEEKYGQVSPLLATYFAFMYGFGDYYGDIMIPFYDWIFSRGGKVPDFVVLHTLSGQKHQLVLSSEEYRMLDIPDEWRPSSEDYMLEEERFYAGGSPSDAT
jgi:hypothetical protein